jgi:hypothetical protein
MGIPPEILSLLVALSFTPFSVWLPRMAMNSLCDAIEFWY